MIVHIWAMHYEIKDFEFVQGLYDDCPRQTRDHIRLRVPVFTFPKPAVKKEVACTK